MAESIVSDWINDFNGLEPQQLRSFAALHNENQELSQAIHTILNDKSKHQEYLHPICNQLYNFYRSNENELKCFTLQFFPNLIYLYLNSIACSEKHNYRCVETLILCAYNIEVCNENGLLKSVSYRMPVLAQASIYHEEKNLHASDLKRWEEHSNKEVSWRSLQQVYKITAQNRLAVMSALMFIFNQQLSLIQKSALYHLCKNSSKLAAQGFIKYGHSYRSSYGNDPINTSISSASSTTSAPNINKMTPRIPLSQQFLLEVLNAIYFAMFNEFASAGIQAVDDIHNRACYELLSDVILVTTAIKNSLQTNPSGQPSDGLMGISVALTPSTNVVTVSKSMITNASFRTKKLPDDIPIQIDSNTSVNQSNPSTQLQAQQLGSINEEQESDTSSAKLQQQSSTTTVSTQKSSKEASKGHKTVVSGLKKLIDRDKDSKDKDKDKDDEGKKKEKEKVEKELSKAASVIKSGLNDTKENMKKLMGKDKQNSKASLQQQTQSNHHDEHQTSINNGDIKSSPLVLMKRSSDVLSDGATEVSITNVVDGVISNNNGTGTHGIMSPFDSFNSDSESEVDHPHQQLSTSSSASINIMMDSNAKSLANVQVSQV
jgi:hypothetical protein